MKMQVIPTKLVVSSVCSLGFHASPDKLVICGMVCFLVAEEETVSCCSG